MSVQGGEGRAVKHLSIMAAIAAAFVSSAALAQRPAAASGRPQPTQPVSPVRELCRILIPGLPAERQPPPMDCDAARRQAAIAGGEVVVVGREPRGSLRFSVSDERYRRDQAFRDAREEERSRRERNREWRDGTWDDRNRFDDDDLRVWPDD